MIGDTSIYKACEVKFVVSLVVVVVVVVCMCVYVCMYVCILITYDLPPPPPSPHNYGFSLVGDPRANPRK